jgi:hypothetical protein
MVATVTLPTPLAAEKICPKDILTNATSRSVLEACPADPDSTGRNGKRDVV